MRRGRGPVSDRFPLAARGRGRGFQGRDRAQEYRGRAGAGVPEREFPSRGHNFDSLSNSERGPPHRPAWTPAFPPILTRPQTYAQVVQNIPPRARSAQAQRIKWNRAHSENTDYIKPDKKFKQKIHIFFDLIKAVHHGRNVMDENNRPKVLEGMVEVLSTFVKPALPSPQTQALIVGNAKNWGHTTILILKQHYEDKVVELLQEVEKLDRTEWEDPFKVAERWAYRRLVRLQDTTVDEVREMIVATVQDGPPATQDDEIQNPRPLQKTGVTVRDQGTDPPSRLSSPDQIRPQPDVGPEVNIETPQLPQRIHTNRRVRIRTRPIVEELECPEGESSRVTVEPSTGDLVVLGGDVLLEPIREGELSPNMRVMRDLSMDLEEKAGQPTAEDAEDETDGDGDSLPDGQGSPSLFSQLEDVQGEETYPEDGGNGAPSNMKTGTPAPEPGQVTTHSTGFKKLAKWTLTLRKKKVIMGDSNLDIVKVFQDEELQIDSFPGGTFHHAGVLLGRAGVGEQVQQLVLCFGIGHHTQKVPLTAIKQLQTAIRKAREVCPNAKIWVPLIHYDPTLSESSIQTLRELNNYIQTHLTYIPLIPQEQFQTRDDKIHWTRGTAESIINNILQALN